MNRRPLALIVHAQDLTQQSRRVAITRALRAPNSALDFLQLRSAGDDANEGAAALADAGKCLRELLVAAAHDNASDSALPAKQPSLIMNASLDAVAALANREDRSVFDGWHVKERDLFRAELPPLIAHARARREQTIVGCSVHSVACAVHAARLGVDYIQVGTMFSTPSHPEKASLQQLEGPQLLRAICSRAVDEDLVLPPLVAVGGISTPQQIRCVLSAGADGVAVIRGILAAADARATAAQYRAVLDDHGDGTGHGSRQYARGRQ